MDDVVLRDRTGPDGRTRTLTFDLPAPWLLHALFRSDTYVSHVAGVATVDVALADDEYYAVGTVVPTDGQDPDERTFDDYFSGSESMPQNGASITFRTDLHDVEEVVPVVEAAVADVRSVYEDVCSP